MSAPSSCFLTTFRTFFYPSESHILVLNSDPLCSFLPFRNTRTSTLAPVPSTPKAQMGAKPDVLIRLNHLQMCCPRAQAVLAIIVFLALVPYPWSAQPLAQQGRLHVGSPLQPSSSVGSRGSGGVLPESGSDAKMETPGSPGVCYQSLLTSLHPLRVKWQT